MKQISTVSDSYALAIEKSGMFFTGTRNDLLNTIREMRQLGLWKPSQSEVMS